MQVSARETALKALSRYRRDAAFSEAALNSVLLRDTPDSRDTALASRIFYGVIQNTALLDYYIAAFSTVRPAKMEPQVLDILRLSAYQLVFMSKIPANAAVSEGVELVKKHANPRAVGLANAVLRKISANLERLPEIAGIDEAGKLSIKYSHPAWLVSSFIDRLGADGTEALLRENNSDTSVTLMVNTLKTDTDTVLKSLKADHFEGILHPWLSNCIVLRTIPNIERLSVFTDGAVYVQDPAAALTVAAALQADAAASSSGLFVIDGCAAPGGKSFAAAVAMKNTGRILACDIHEKKLGRVAEGARRLGINTIATRVADAKTRNPLLFDSADVVLADVPCSGFGVIRKKPEIRYKREEDLADLPALQGIIADNLSTYVRPGGCLLYSTCTLLERENEGVVNAFLKTHGDFQPESFVLPGPVGVTPSGMLTLWPHVHGTDGFFICRLRRRS